MEKKKEDYMKFSFFLVSADVWHIGRYFENLKFYNSFRIIFYKIHSDYILKHNENYSPEIHHCLCVPASIPALPPTPFWFLVHYTCSYDSFLS